MRVSYACIGYDGPHIQVEAAQFVRQMNCHRGGEWIDFSTYFLCLVAEEIISEFDSTWKMAQCHHCWLYDHWEINHAWLKNSTFFSLYKPALVSCKTQTRTEEKTLALYACSERKYGFIHRFVSCSSGAESGCASTWVLSLAQHFELIIII